MRHRLQRAIHLAVILCGAPLAAASAQTGLVNLYTHLAGSANSAPVLRTFLQTSSGPQEIFTQEFAPGTYTFSRVDAQVGPCRAIASNVSFTITANHWTTVDVPVALADCALGVEIQVFGGQNSGGTGQVTVVQESSLGNNQTVASCHSAKESNGMLGWVAFHSCHGVIAYGSTEIVTTASDVGSCCAYNTDSFVVDTARQLAPFYSFSDTTGATPPIAHFNADLSIALVSSSYGGQTMSSTFRVVNHGPDNAYRVTLTRLGDSLEDGPQVQVSQSSTDANCPGQCELAFLPAGDSTTFTVRYSGFPDDANDPVPPRTQFCAGVTVASVAANGDPGQADPNPSNNTAPCIVETLPVTVALGGSSPANKVVQKGSTSVPMLEFALTPASLATLSNVTIKASGSGNEQVDVTAARLYLDKNGDGLVNGTDSVLASGAFAANDGSVTLTLNPAFAITGQVNILVTYDFNTTLAERLGGGLSLAIFPLLLIPAMRRRRRLAMLALLMVAGVTLASCGSSSTGPGNSSASTYQATLTGLTVSGISKSDLSVPGATITIDK